MEAAQEILLNSLKNSGVSLPTEISSIQDLTPGALVSICAQALHLIDDSSSFPASLPESMAERFKICTEISSSIQNLGYRGNMSFHQFLYPSEEDSYKLMRFLVEKLSKASEGGNVADKKEIKTSLIAKEDNLKGTSEDSIEEVDHTGVDLNYQTVKTRLKELKLKTEVPESTDLISQQCDEPAAADISKVGSSKPRVKEELSRVENVKDLMKELGDSRKDASENEESHQKHDTRAAEFGKNLSLLQKKSSKIRNQIEDLRSQEIMLMEELTEKASEYQHLENEHEVLKAAVEMAFDHHHPIDFYVEELNKRIEAGRQKLLEMESQWDAFRKPLEERKISLVESLYVQKPEMLEKLQKVKEIELETEAIVSEIQKREKEHSRLSVELENQPKIASRKSYIQRINEITKNSRKQDADVERILQETRELQIESNSIQDRLHRSHAVVDETIFRDAKKDPVRRQAYRLLTSIHESFEQISEKILATDRTRREVAEHEAKLTTMASRSLDINKLEADLEAIRKENEFLEQRLRHN